jgi:hypothetical protein
LAHRQHQQQEAGGDVVAEEDVVAEKLAPENTIENAPENTIEPDEERDDDVN